MLWIHILAVTADVVALARRHDVFRIGKGWKVLKSSFFQILPPSLPDDDLGAKIENLLRACSAFDARE